MEWLNNNLTESLVYLGLALLALEIIVLGFSTFVLFFIGLACVLAGALMFVGVLPESPMSALLSVALLTAGLGMGLWKPLKKMQEKVEVTTPQSDLIGHSFILSSDISPTKKGSHDYSGISWKIISADTLVAGTEVQVVKAEVGAFTVAAK